MFTFTDYEKWTAEAYKAGWVHTHDDVVVCDDEHGCIGEWDDDIGQGWLNPRGVERANSRAS